MISFLKKIYVLVSPHVVWFVVSLVTLDLIFRKTSDADLVKLYRNLDNNGKLTGLIILGSFFGFLYRTFRRAKSANPLIELFDFEGNELQKNHSQPGGTTHIQTCAQENECFDLHLLNLRLVDDDPIFEIAAGFPKSEQLGPVGIRRLYKGHEFQVRCRIKDFKDLVRSENNDHFTLYLSFKKKNGDLYREVYRVYVKEQHEERGECGTYYYQIQNFDVVRNSLFQMTRLEILKSLWLNTIKFLRFRTQFSDDEWVGML